MNAPCANLKSEPDVIPVATSVVFDTPRVRRGGSVTATFAGNNLTSATYFDVRFRAPGANADDVALNWQQGLSGSHAVHRPRLGATGTITGVRAHQDPSDQSGPFAPFQATFSVFVSPYLSQRAWGTSQDCWEISQGLELFCPSVDFFRSSVGKLRKTAAKFPKA
jgi:hypothetical protein